MTQIPSQARRCSACGGDFKMCMSPACRRLRGVVEEKKFVGLLRGGFRPKYRCMFCTKLVS